MTSDRLVPNLSVRGMDESDVFAYAPVMSCDRVYWDSPDGIDMDAITDALDLTAWTRQWSDGQRRVWVENGSGDAARDQIAEWCAQHRIDQSNMRVERGVPFRNVDAIPMGLFPELVVAAIDWLYPRTHTIRRRLVAELDLVDDDDVRSMMYLFISDISDRYDSQRQGRNGSLNFLAFIYGKLRTWPQDAARAAYGRNAVDDKVRFRKAREDFMSTRHREATAEDLATLVNTDVADVHQRELVMASMRAVRYARTIDGPIDDPDGAAVQVADETDVASLATAGMDASALTRAVLHSCHGAFGSRESIQSDPLGLASVYLTFWGERTRQAAAEELGVLPKTVTASVNRVLSRMTTSYAMEDDQA